MVCIYTCTCYIYGGVIDCTWPFIFQVTMEMQRSELVENPQTLSKLIVLMPTCEGEAWS